VANQKTSCIRKGVVIGHAAECMSELYSQIDIFEEIDVPLTKTVLKDLRALVGPLRKNFKGAAEAVVAIDQGARRLEQALKMKPGAIPREQLQADAKGLRDSLRKIVRTAFGECGKPNPYASGTVDVTGDLAFYRDARQDAGEPEPPRPS